MNECYIATYDVYTLQLRTLSDHYHGNYIMSQSPLRSDTDKDTDLSGLILYNATINHNDAGILKTGHANI